MTLYAIQCSLPAMKIGLRQFGDETVHWFRQAAASGELTRSGLARELCERTDWRNQRGDLCLAQARTVVPQLAARLNIPLPAPVKSVPHPRHHPPCAPMADCACDLEALGVVSVEPVLGTQTPDWQAMMHAWHPQGAPRLPGGALKYWVVSEHAGRLGGLSFHAASWHEQARDDFIGWSARARVHNLHRVINNARFLILPQVRVQGLASQVLRLAVDRVRGDWHQAYGVLPQLAYTHLDQAHSGQSYRASGWHHVGETSGRRCVRGDRKRVYVLPLQQGWQSRLQAAPQARFRAAHCPGLPETAHWTEWEYGASTHPDGRIATRLLAMGRAWDDARADETPRIFRTAASRKAAARLLSNEQVSMDDILESHRQSTVLRCAQHPVVLAVQDTTAFNFDTLKHSTRGLTSIGGTARGVCAHASVAFSETGSRMLGVLEIDGHFRTRAADDAQLTESVRWVEGLELAGELASACADTRRLMAEGEAPVPAPTRVVTVCDREGDDWAMFERQHALADQVGLLVRSHGARRRRVLCDGRLVPLRTHLESLDPVAQKPVTLGAQGGARARTGRTAQVCLRIARVHLKAPAGATGHDSLPVIAVSITEDDPPEQIREPVNWLLLCTEGDVDADTALRICRWYETRWGIEEYFRVLKSGCEIEKRQFDDTEALLKCLAFDAVTAWRVFDLQRRAKHEPDTPAREVVEPEEIATCQLLLHDLYPKMPIRAPPDLSIREYVVNLGRLAGFQPSTRQPVPGTKLLWLGTVEVMAGIRTLRALTAGKINVEEWDSG